MDMLAKGVCIRDEMRDSYVSSGIEEMPPLRESFAKLEIPIVVVDRDLRIVELTDAAKTIFKGVAAGSRLLPSGVDPVEWAFWELQVHRLIDTHDVFIGGLSIGLRGYLVRVDPRSSTQQGGAGAMITVVDIGPRVDKKSDVTNVLFKLLEASADGALIIKVRGGNRQIIHATASFSKITGFSKADVVGRDLEYILNPQLNRDIFKSIDWATEDGETVKVESLGQTKDGGRFLAEVQVLPIAAHSESYGLFLLLFSDMTHQWRVKRTECLYRDANFDEVTGLANNALCIARLQRGLRSAECHQTLCCLLSIQLEGLDQIRDALGHLAADDVLAAVAQRIRLCVRDIDTVSYSGGDEFAAVLVDLPDTSAAARVANEVLVRLAEEFNVGSQYVCLTSCLGIATYPVNAQDEDKLIWCAHTALRQAKESGLNTFCFSAARDDVRVDVVPKLIA